ncbi:MAG: SBBP repeat-containing protein, partial [Bacteroidia bacterium]|nr:SBBP repeat-containing protein [Bacteroidia bacterium]
QTTHGGGWGGDVFVTKLNASGSSLDYSTYIGGSSADVGNGIAVDGSGYAYITGGTFYTIDYDITPCTYQSTHGGGDEDLFVTVVSPGGTYLAYSTYLGGTGHEEPGGITLDNSGYVYVCGYTGEGYPTTPGAFQTIYDGGWHDVVVTKLEPECILSTFSLKVSVNYCFENKGVFITWQSTIQEPIQHFVVEKWQNNTWQGIAQANSSTSSYQDKEGVYAGATHIYRIRAVNKDGQSYYSNVATITVPEQDKSFTLYPNPAQNYVVVENYTNSIQEYELSDISGKALQVYTLPQGKNTIELNLPKGMYFIRARRGGKAERFVVE